VDFEEMGRAYDQMSKSTYTQGTRPTVNAKWQNYNDWDAPNPSDFVRHESDFIVVQVEGGYLIARSRDGLGSLVYITVASTPNYEDAVEIASSLNKTVW
jgi:hypothetical protein